MDDELERIREQKREKLRAAQQDNQSNEESDENLALRKGLTEDARQRLSTLEMAYPDRAEAIKTKLAALIEANRVQTPITDDDVKQLLEELDDSTDYDIRRV